MADIADAEFPSEDESGEEIRLIVPPALAGERLDRAAAALAAEAGLALSRARLQDLIGEGRLTVDGRAQNASRKVAAGQTLLLTVPPAAPAIPEPQDIPLTVVYEDDWLLVIDKPAGMVVHPAAGNADGTLVNALLFHCAGSLSGIGGVARPGIVHRLDKDTSGLMVVAKNDTAHRALSAQFADRSIGRTYGAVVWGMPNPVNGRIEGDIGRDPGHRQRMAVVTHNGKPATTHYTMQEGFGPAGELPAATLVHCVLETGRTHQIRVHLTARGHPLLGDPLYGYSTARNAQRRLTETGTAALARLKGQALHAFALKFIHPQDGELRQFSADYPQDYRDLLTSLRSAESWRSLAKAR